MTLDDIMARLQSLKNETTWKLNEKNGAAGQQFGVMHGDIRTVAKRVKTDHALALQLWNSGNVDARLLAILIMKPKALTMADIDRLIRTNAFLWVSDWFNSYILKQHPDKETLRQNWAQETHPIVARAYWNLTAERVSKLPDGLDLTAILDRLETEMLTVPEPVQWTMNTTLAAIGIHHPTHRTRAMDIGERLGIYRDYPTPKGCTSPFVPRWIAEMVRRST